MAGQAPTGLVSLVFTDVQGSTTLWERVPDAMRDALEVHDRVLREAIAKNGGYEVKTEGDAFMAAFASPVDAVRFCLDAQMSLMDAAWPEAIFAEDSAAAAPQRRGLRVRMGVHAGEPDCRIDPTTGRMDYFGPVVNRAARVSAATHGGQIVVTKDVWDPIEPKLAALGAPVVASLGEHRLKDIESASHLWQILPAPLAARTFPPLKTLDARKTNLQPHPTPFVGREPDLAALQALFAKGERLVTLLGPGGTGKTRLSMRYAAVHLEEFTRDGGGGAWFCDLTEARNVDGICAAMGAALNVPLTTGKTSADVVAQLGHAIAGRARVLLILDNFEQVISQAPETVGIWFRLAPQACFLISSQERLRLPGETRYELKPLALPEGSDIRASEAVQLFVERARAVRPGWTLADADVEAVAGIVRELDGIPLAIELAAARIGVLSPAKILERLPRRFDLLGGARRDATSRQATLRGAIDWSWNLLKPHEQDALAQCSVFHAGFTVEAAEEVLDLASHEGAPWALDIVESLRDKSLLRALEPPEFPGELRFGMYANIRQYAQEKLDADKAKAEATKARHTGYYLRVGGEWADGVDTHGGLEKLRRLALERDNLVTVFHRAKAGASPAAAVDALLALDPVLSTRGPFGTHLQWLDEAIGSAATVAPALRARIVEARGRARRVRGRMAEAMTDFEEALALATQNPGLKARVLAQLGIAQVQQGNMLEAEKTLEEGLAHAGSAADRIVAGQLLGFLGSVHGELARPQEARASFEQALKIFRETGSRAAEGRVLGNLGIVLWRVGDLEAARSATEEALAISRETSDRRFEGNALGTLAAVQVELGQLGEARIRYGEAVAIQREVGNVRSEAIFRGNLAILDQLEGRRETARDGFAAAVVALGEAGEKRGEALYLGYLGASEAALGNLDAARPRFRDAIARLESLKEATLLAAVRILEGSLDLAEAATSSAPEQAAELRAGVRARLARITGSAEGARAAPLVAASEDVRLALRLIERMFQGEADRSHPRNGG